MKHPTKSRTSLLLSALATSLIVITLSGCTAAAFGKPSLPLAVQSAVSSGHVNVYVLDGTAILTGRVESSYDASAAARAALRYDEVERVDNRIDIIR